MFVRSCRFCFRTRGALAVRFGNGFRFVTRGGGRGGRRISGVNHTRTIEFAGLGGGDNCGSSVVDGGELIVVGAGGGLVLALGWGRLDVMLVGERFLPAGGAGVDSAAAAVEADVGWVGDDLPLVHVAGDVDVHVVYAAVIEKVVAV